MLEDAWFGARTQLIEFAQLHENLVWAGLVLAVICYFVYQWRSAR